MTRPIPFSANLETDSTKNRITVVVSGDFESASVQVFDEAVVRAIELGSASVVVDLAATDLIDSAAIGAIMRFRQQVTTRGSSFVVVAPREFQQRLFQITGLSHVLDADSRSDDPPSG